MEVRKTTSCQLIPNPTPTSYENERISNSSQNGRNVQNQNISDFSNESQSKITSASSASSDASSAATSAITPTSTSTATQSPTPPLISTNQASPNLPLILGISIPLLLLLAILVWLCWKRSKGGDEVTAANLPFARMEEVEDIPRIARMEEAPKYVTAGYIQPEEVPDDPPLAREVTAGNIARNEVGKEYSSYPSNPEYSYPSLAIPAIARLNNDFPSRLNKIPTSRLEQSRNIPPSRYQIPSSYPTNYTPQDSYEDSLLDNSSKFDPSNSYTEKAAPGEKDVPVTAIGEKPVPATAIGEKAVPITVIAAAALLANKKRDGSDTKEPISRNTPSPKHPSDDEIYMRNSKPITSKRSQCRSQSRSPPPKHAPKDEIPINGQEYYSNLRPVKTTSPVYPDVLTGTEEAIYFHSDDDDAKGLDSFLT